MNLVSCGLKSLLDGTDTSWNPVKLVYNPLGRIRNLALESRIFGLINSCKFPQISGYFNSARLTPITLSHMCSHLRSGLKGVKSNSLVQGVHKQKRNV